MHGEPSIKIRDVSVLPTSQFRGGSLLLLLAARNYKL